MGLLWNEGKGWAFSAFLPSPGTVLRLFDVPITLAGVVRWGEKESGWEGTRPSDSTINTIAAGGGSDASRRKLEQFLPDEMMPTPEALDVYAGLHGALFSRHDWATFFSGLSASQGELGPEVDLLQAFIKERMLVEERLQGEVFPSGLREPAVANPINVLARYVRLPEPWPTLCQAGVSGLEQLIDDGLVSRAQVFELSLALELDFIFHALSSLEAGILKCWREITPTLEDEYPLVALRGLMIPMLPRIENGRVYGPYNGFLEMLRDRFGESENTWKSLSVDIPVRYEEIKGDLENNQSRWDLLKKWRHSKTYPSFDVMGALVERRMPSSSAAWGVRLVERAARALDRFFVGHLRYADKHYGPDGKEIVVRAYRRYEDLKVGADEPPA